MGASLLAVAKSIYYICVVLLKRRPLCFRLNTGIDLSAIYFLGHLM